jgi:hypothetical protein
MEHWSSIVAALVLGGTSAGLIAWQVRGWRRLPLDELEDREREFRRRQFRRRVQTSGMLGVIGAAILIGQLLLSWAAARDYVALHWCGVILLVLWLLLLTVADLAATGFYYRREKNYHAAERARLQGELRQAQEVKARGHNGKPGGHS